MAAYTKLQSPIPKPTQAPLRSEALIVFRSVAERNAGQRNRVSSCRV